MTPSNPTTVIRQLVRMTRSAHLGTLLTGSGHPYVSLINTATDGSGAPILLLSALALHAKNLDCDSRASILFVAPPVPEQVDRLEGHRVTVIGRLERTDDKAARDRFLAAHPAAAVYSDFSDFAFWRMVPEQVHSVAGFGRITTFPADAVFFDRDPLAEIERGALDHMNADHADAIQLYATELAGRPAGAWRMSALDADGFVMANGNDSIRLAFDPPVTNASTLRTALKEMAELARAPRVDRPRETL